LAHRCSLHRRTRGAWSRCMTMIRRLIWLQELPTGWFCSAQGLCRLSVAAFKVCIRVDGACAGGVRHLIWWPASNSMLRTMPCAFNEGMVGECLSAVCMAPCGRLPYSVRWLQLQHQLSLWFAGSVHHALQALLVAATWNCDGRCNKRGQGIIGGAEHRQSGCYHIIIGPTMHALCTAALLPRYARVICTAAVC
jgi:hypothetical protein